MERSGKQALVLGLLAAVLAAGAAGCTYDIVHFSNRNPVAEVGVIVHGRKGSADTHDYTKTTATARVDVGRFNAGSHNEIVAFQEERPVSVLETVPWSPDDDEVTVDLGGSPLGLAITVWILKKPFGEMKERAIDACVRTAEIWKSERMGTEIVGWEVNDVTTDDEEILKFESPDVGRLKELGFTPDRVNIYFVDQVEGEYTRGASWLPDVAVLGSEASDDLAAHEIGHLMGLFHVDVPGDDTALSADTRAALADSFDTTNLMHSASDDRTFLTEGQTFRSHLSSFSAINSIYKLRSGPVRDDCGAYDVIGTDMCPKIQKRIWADGPSFPPN